MILHKFFFEIRKEHTEAGRCKAGARPRFLPGLALMTVVTGGGTSFITNAMPLTCAVANKK